MVGQRNDRTRPQVRRQSRKLQAAIGHFLPQLGALGLGIKLRGMGMGRKAAQFHAVERQLAELVDHRVKGDGIVLVRPEAIGPTSDGKSDSFHGAPRDFGIRRSGVPS